MRYWDASAIVPLLVQEPRTSAVRAALAEDAGIVTWWGTRIECTSAIARPQRAASLTPRQATQQPVDKVPRWPLSTRKPAVFTGAALPAPPP